MSLEVFQIFAVFVPEKLSFVPQKILENSRMAPEKYGMYLCKQYQTGQSLGSADSQAVIGRMSADIRRLSVDGYLMKSADNPPTSHDVPRFGSTTVGRRSVWVIRL